MSVKNLLRRTLPAPVFGALRHAATTVRRRIDFCKLCLDYLHDARRYAHWSHTGRSDVRRGQREYALLKAYHGIEKGLSMAEPRPGFGKEKVRDLLARTSGLRVRYPDSEEAVAATASILAYRKFNHDHDVRLPWLDDWTRTAESADAATGGTRELRREDVEAAVAGVTPEFFTTRHSIRNFAPGDVPLEDMKAAVALAQKSPSVCNRQGAKAYCFMNAMDALQYQPGNRGFGHLASRGVVITADLQAFSSIGERHQAYIDGGLFAMSLVYALHSMGYGTCTLAWNSRAAAEARLRATLGIPDSEVVVMMIAVGRLPDSLRVACAWRRPLSRALVVKTSTEKASDQALPAPADGKHSPACANDAPLVARNVNSA